MKKVVIFFFVVFSMFGCNFGSSEVVDLCNGLCREGQSCFDGNCLTTCNTDFQCQEKHGGGWECIGGGCQLGVYGVDSFGRKDPRWETDVQIQDDLKESDQSRSEEDDLFEEKNSEVLPVCIPSKELCDGIDNDCDGLIDEDFSFDNDPLNCGSCGKSCREINAVNHCQQGECVFACLPNFYDFTDDPGCETVCVKTNNGKEQCDGIDNDCDGLIDEDFDFNSLSHCGGCGKICSFPNTNAVCLGGNCLMGDCHEGFVNLNKSGDDGCEYSCIYSGDEICDGIDNDCDGSIDELIYCQCEEGKEEDCGINVGICRYGKRVCQNGQWSICQNALVPQPEKCNYLDDNCDGLIDEGFDLSSDVNNCGYCGLVCSFVNATAKCVAGKCQIASCDYGWWLDDGGNCSYSCLLTNGGIEQCDGIDNDCDGLIDEDFDFSSDLDHCGSCGKKCSNYGVAISSCVAGKCHILTCQENYYNLNGDFSDGCEYFCEISNGGIEIGDNKDNNCDGNIDEGTLCYEDMKDICGIDVGICRYGFRECINDRWTDCDDIKPQAEVCDGLDNDCDGLIDEDFNLLSDKNNCGQCGNSCSLSNSVSTCYSGSCLVMYCLSGWKNLDNDHSNGCEYPCHLSNEGIEKCDGIDNNCDGVEDEDFDLLSDHFNCGVCGNVCRFDNGVGACINGECLLQYCQPDYYNLDNLDYNGCEYICSITNGGIEDCDGLDNDCDGTLDEYCECLNGDYQICGSNEGQCRWGLKHCVGGQWSDCQGQVSPVAEICDGLDNNCNGQVDEGFNLNSDVNHCGKCGNACPKFNSGFSYCQQGVCKLDCFVGFKNLDEDIFTGCEYQCFPTLGGVEACDDIDNNCNGKIDESFDFLNDADNCGSCGVRCHFTGAVGYCDLGVCRADTCLLNYYNIDGDWQNGCEYYCVMSNGGLEIWDNRDNNCNGVTDEGALCVEGSVGFCGSDVGTCQKGTHECKQNKWSDCVNEKLPTAELCDGLDNDCDGLSDEDFNFMTDKQNCGGCGNVCDFPNANSLCLNGVCAISSCWESFYNQDGKIDTGCEYQCLVSNGGVEKCDSLDNNCNGQVDEGFNLNSDVKNCGSCGNDCTKLPQVASSSCVNGQCIIQGCVNGYHHLDVDVDNGCEYFCLLSGVEIFDLKDNDCDGEIDEKTTSSDIIQCSLCCNQGSAPMVWFGSKEFWTTLDASSCGSFLMTQEQLCQRGDHPNYPSSAWVDVSCYDGTWSGFPLNGVINCFNLTKNQPAIWQVIVGTVDARGESEIILSGVCPQ